MAEKTIIAWTDNTFNIAWGCVKVSPGCKNCYAETIAERRSYGRPGVWGKGTPRRTFGDSHWGKPAVWNRAAKKAGKILRAFSSSMCDNFEDHDTITQEMKRLWEVIRATPWIHWQILTKRIERVYDNLPDDWGRGYRNVWLGTSIENNDYAYRADILGEIPARVRFISYEPALGPLDQVDLSVLDWVIYGGESGPGFRPQDDAWPRQMRDLCKEAEVAFYHKQSSGIRTEMGIELDGKIVREMPLDREPGCPIGIYEDEA